jgi:hypothetical protein
MFQYLLQIYHFESAILVWLPDIQKKTNDFIIYE